MNRSPLWVFFLLFAALGFGGCGTSSTVIFSDETSEDIQITHSDTTFIYGYRETSGQEVKIAREDIELIEFPGAGHVLAGQILTIFGGVSVAFGGVALLLSEGEDYFGWLVIGGGAMYLAMGIPTLLWGTNTEEEAKEKSGWVNPPIHFNLFGITIGEGEGETTYYGLGISGRF